MYLLNKHGKLENCMMQDGQETILHPSYRNAHGPPLRIAGMLVRGAMGEMKKK